MPIRISILLTAVLALSQSLNAQEGQFSELERVNLIRIQVANQRLGDHIRPNLHLWGELPMKNDTMPRYDSIRRAIRWRDENVTFDPLGMAHDDPGMTWEVARYMALFRLDQTLKHAMDTSQRNEYRDDYQDFVEIFEGKLPRAAFDHKQQLIPVIQEIIKPEMTLTMARTLLEETPGLRHADRFAIAQAFQEAYTKVLNRFTLEYFRAMGGRSQQVGPILLAAGSGSSAARRTFEKELYMRDLEGKRLRRSLRFIPYQLQEYKVNDVQRYGTMKVASSRFRVKGGDTTTLLHLTTLGLTPKFQTTVIVEYKGHQYRLFGNEDDRELSPVFKPEKHVYTYQSNMDELKEVHIAELEEMIYGRRGYDYWIEWWKEEYHKAELNVAKSEKSLAHNSINYKPGKVKPPKRKEKDVHPDSKTTPPTPKATSDKKQKGSLQNDVMYYYGIMEKAKAEIKALEQKKLEALEMLERYRRLLQDMENIYGRAPRQYKKVKGGYLFDDGAFWDPSKQNMHFPKSDGTEFGSVRLLSYGPTPLTDGVEDFFLSGATLDDVDGYHGIHRQFLDESFSSRITPDSLFTRSDSIRIKDLSRMLASCDEALFTAQGLGIGLESNGTLEAARNQRVLELSGEQESQYIWGTEIRFHGRERLTIDVKSSTPNAEVPAPAAPLEGLEGTNNQHLTATRSSIVAKRLVDELIALMSIYAPKEYRSKAISKLKKAYKNGVLKVGSTMLPLP